MPTTAERNDSDDTLAITAPVATDARAVLDLITRCPPLDRNSLYCYLLLCSHFADTCAVARLGDDVVGFVSGYRPPREDGVLFVWQVAVDPRARGRALARRLITDILRRESCAGVSLVHTTVTPSNGASRAMFERLAQELGAGVEIRSHFDRDTHLAGEHESEELFVIGPFDRAATAQELV